MLPTPLPRNRRGFTLIQLLVAIGIIIMLIGLLLPAVVRAYKSSVRTRTEMDLHLIAEALEHYRTDFGDYPRLDNDNSNFGLNQLKDRGARLLCRALIGPGPSFATAKLQNSGATADFAPGTGVGPDGADGPGFRVREGTGGKTYGPYLQTDKFNLGGTDKTFFSDATILDRDNNPILYYPATPHAVITATNTYAQFILSEGPPAGPNNYTVHPLYNSWDNEKYIPLSELQWLLGDKNNNGQLDPGEVAVYTGPFILWSAGADGIYGRDPKGKTDDITNFDFPGEIRK